jgi:aminoglycoside phosphotransferase (APT) family kinase protein
LRDADRPAVDALAAALAERVPRAPSGPVVHGDYRLDNVVLDPADPARVAAVLDWEMSTLGDPLADVGLLLVYWRQGRADDRATVTPSVTGLPGFPTRAEVVARYAGRTGRDVSALPWYVAFGYFKLAVVVAGIVARQKAGAMADNRDDGLARAIDPLAEGGRAALGGADW